MRANCSTRGLFDGLICAFMFLLCCRLSATTVRQKPDSALTVVEGGDGGGDSGEDATTTATEEEESHLKVVQPTSEWQTLKPGEAVPRGSHVRLNLQTGQREVRQGEEQRKYSARKLRQNVEEGQHRSFSTAELKEALQKMEALHAENSDNNEDTVRSQFRPLEELKRDMADLDMLVETDAQILSRLLAQFRSTNITTERQLKILLELEYLVHQVDNAQTLFSMGGLQIMLDCLNSSNYQLQEGSAFVLGSALSSNPVVQVEAAENGTLQRLLTLLATPRPHSVKKKVLFAVASLLRHFPHAQNHFLSHGGLQVLSELFRGEGGEGLRVRIITLLYDMISEREVVLQAGMEPIPDEAHEERLRQYSRVPLQPQLLEGGWCTLVPELLDSSEHDWREKTLRTLLAMAPVCLSQYRSDGTLSFTLGVLRGQYQELVHTERNLGEENGYFGEILDLLDTLEFKLKWL